MGRIKDNADEIYRTEWGGSQFAKPDNTVRGARYDADKESRYQAWKAQQGR